METLQEIKKEREQVPDFMYIQRLEDYCGQLEDEIKKLNREIGGYSGRLDALTEEFNFLITRLNLLKKEMISS